MAQKYLAIVNPAAGGGRSRALLGSALERLHAGGLEIELAETRSAGDATTIAREAHGRGVRNFIAAGGDGTSFEIVNGLFPQASGSERPTLGFLPLGTGNSFLREFSDRGVEYGIESLLAQRSSTCDVLRLRHRTGVLHYINLLSMGFSADVATLRARRFSAWGEIGYQASIFLTLARFKRRPFPVRLDGGGNFDNRPCLFLTFSNGTHIEHPLAERKSVRRVEFNLEDPADVMVDGEVLTLQCEELDVLPGALNVVA